MKFKTPNINVGIILITLKIMYDFFFILIDFTNAIIEKMGQIGIRLKIYGITVRKKMIFEWILGYPQTLIINIEKAQAIHKKEQK